MQAFISQNDQSTMIEMKEQEFECQNTHKMDNEGKATIKPTENQGINNKLEKTLKNRKKDWYCFDEQSSGDDQSGTQLAKCLINFRVAVADNTQMITSILSPNGTSFVKQFLSEQTTPLLLYFLRKLSTQQPEDTFTLQECKIMQVQATQVFDKCYASVFSRLSSRELEEYQIILAEYESIRCTSKQYQKRLKECKQDDEKSILKMYKIDVLSLLLLKDYQYQQLFLRFGVTKLGILQILRTKFKIVGNKINLPKLMNNMMNYIDFDYEEEFRHIISLLCLIEITFYVCRYKHQKRKLSEKRKRKEMERQMKAIDLQERKSRVEHRPQVIKLKFCEIAAFCVKDYSSDDYLKLKKYQALVQLRKAAQLPTLFEKKRIIIKLRASFKVPILFLCQWYEESIKNPRIREEELQMYRKMLEPCKWLYIGTNNFQKPLQKLTNLTIQQGKLSRYRNPINIALTELTFQRLKQCTYYTNMQIELSRRVKRVEPIYIFVYYFSFNRLFGHFQAENRQCITCTMIIAMRNNSIVFVETIDSKIDYQQISSLLINYFKNKTLLFGGDLVIFKNNIGRAIQKTSHYRLINMFKSKHNSHVYFTSDPNSFQLSFAICYTIIDCLRRNAILINSQNFSQQVVEHTTNVILCVSEGYQGSIKKEE